MRSCQTSSSIHQCFLRIALLLILLMAFLPGYSQERKPVFLGIQPMVTQEKFYEDDEVDVNILPFTVEFSVGKRVNLRFTSLLNYHFCDNSQVSDIGFQAVVPVFFNKQESKLSRSYGFYVAPVLGLGQNLMNDHFTTTLAVEPGYQFKANKRFTLSMGIQYGGSHFNYNNKQKSEWTEHFGVKVNFGFWL